MAETRLSPEDARIMGQQAGRRLTGNQQRELTELQQNHPDAVEAAEERMKDAERERDGELNRRVDDDTARRGVHVETAPAAPPADPDGLDAAGPESPVISSIRKGRSEEDNF